MECLNEQSSISFRWPEWCFELEFCAAIHLCEQCLYLAKYRPCTLYYRRITHPPIQHRVTSIDSKVSKVIDSSFCNFVSKIFDAPVQVSKPKKVKPHSTKQSMYTRQKRQVKAQTFIYIFQLYFFVNKFFLFDVSK